MPFPEGHGVSRSAVAPADLADRPQPAAYAYDYTVEDDHSGNAFSKKENRAGESTQGSYQVALPDGRLQTVTYSADTAGFNAQVTYQGEAQYPPEEQYKAAPAPAKYSTPAYKPAPAYKAAPSPAPARYSTPAYKPAAYKAPSPAPNTGYKRPAYKRPARPARKPATYRS